MLLSIYYHTIFGLSELVALFFSDYVVFIFVVMGPIKLIGLVCIVSEKEEIYTTEELRVRVKNVVVFRCENHTSAVLWRCHCK